MAALLPNVRIIYVLTDSSAANVAHWVQHAAFKALREVRRARWAGLSVSPDAGTPKRGAVDFARFDAEKDTRIELMNRCDNAASIPYSPRALSRAAQWSRAGARDSRGAAGFAVRCPSLGCFTSQNPIFVIANYLLDSLRQDLFRTVNG
jgi:hypothetical protein